MARGRRVFQFATRHTRHSSHPSDFARHDGSALGLAPQGDRPDDDAAVTEPWPPVDEAIEEGTGEGSRGHTAGDADTIDAPADPGHVPRAYSEAVIVATLKALQERGILEPNVAKRGKTQANKKRGRSTSGGKAPATQHEASQHGSSRAMDLRIGERLQRARRHNGMTLDALSRASGVSKAMLSQVEHGKTNPTVIVLHKIAMALNISTSELIDEPERPRIFEIVRSGDPKHVLSTNQRCIGRMLSPLWAEKGLEFFELDLPPNGSLISKPHAPQTVEMLSVAKGEIEVRSHEQAVTLNVGDSVTYSADVEHGIRNVGRGEATVYLVVQYATAPW